MILPIDEINRSIPYREYFGVMALTEKQKKDRIAFAERLEDELLLIYMLFSTLKDYSVADDNLIVQQLQQAYLDVVASFAIPQDDYILEIAALFALDFVRVTRRHIEEAWYTSQDRVMYNAENEANTVLNYKDYVDAIGKGYTRKTWITENDSRVRDTHVPLEGETIPISDLFVVGNALMRYPKDIEYAADSPEEIVNCRCSIKYS